MEVLSYDGHHRYLGRMFNLGIVDHSEFEIDNHHHQAWKIYDKYRRVLHDPNLSIRLWL